MVTEKNKSDPAPTPQEQMAELVNEVMSKSLLDLVSNATEADLLGPDKSAEKAKGTTGPATCWLHAPAVLELSSMAYRRLLTVGELAGMKHLDIPKITAKVIGNSKVMLIKAAAENDRTAFEVRRSAGRSSARSNLFDLLGTYGLTEPTGYRERFDVLYVPKESSLWPGLLIDLGAPRERRAEPEPKKKKNTGGTK